MKPELTYLLVRLSLAFCKLELALTGSQTLNSNPSRKLAYLVDPFFSAKCKKYCTALSFKVKTLIDAHIYRVCYSHIPGHLSFVWKTTYQAHYYMQQRRELSPTCIVYVDSIYNYDRTQCANQLRIRLESINLAIMMQPPRAGKFPRCFPSPR